MTTITKKQKAILDYIQDFQEDHGFSPSYREIANHFDLSSIATVFQHIKNLENRGYIRIEENEARSIEIVDTSIPTNNVSVDVIPEIATDMIPLAGLITAGEPIEAVEEKEMISVPATITSGPDDYFALRVKGDSMIEDGIFNGDCVIIRRTNTANNGDVVVALLENQFATLKRFYREKDHIRLQPANASMEPFRIKGNVKIQGVLKGLIRKY